VEVALMRITENDESVFQKLNVCGRMALESMSLSFKIGILIRIYARDIGNFLSSDVAD
jgi:hypothetical protein